ncbi:MAG: FkbM family methyltransferase [Lachnospiraceae bacterium]|nr:FkbM family methyltransferase [Lachnospiraceae bacterium]
MAGTGFVYKNISETSAALLEVLENPELTVRDVMIPLDVWTETVERDAETIEKHSVMLDQAFEQTMLMAEKCSEQALFDRLLSVLCDYADRDPVNCSIMKNFYSEYSYFWGSFDPSSGDYEHFDMAIHAVKQNIDNIRWLYGELADYRSKKVLNGIISYWLELNDDHLKKLREGNYGDYFDLDILQGAMPDETVFVDCGGYTGDTAREYYDSFLRCKRYYLYEMIPKSISMAKETLEKHNEVIYRNVGVGSPAQKGTVIPVKDVVTNSFSLDRYKEAAPGVNAEQHNNAEEVNIRLVTLDEDITEPVTFIKMDIEGSEINALLGAKRHIEADHPVLAICTYHHYEHLWEIPRLIRSINPEYKLYLRYNGMERIMATEHYMLAV